MAEFVLIDCYCVLSCSNFTFNVDRTSICLWKGFICLFSAGNKLP